MNARSLGAMFVPTLLPLLLVSGAPAELGPAPALPLAFAEGSWRALYSSVDARLQGDLERRLDANSQWRTLIRRRKMAVGVVDLSGHDGPRFARVNGRTMMYAASLPKIAILLAAYESFEDGTLEETAACHQDLAEMIRISSNEAATRMMDRIGMDKIEQVLTDPRYQLYDPGRGGGLWVGKRYAKHGSRIGDPLHNISHGATVTQVCRFYYLLATGRIINPERSRQMLEDLAHPELHHKFVSVLELRAPRARLFRKSGTWKDWHSDSVLVWGQEWRRYILAAMVESPQGEQILRDLVPVIEELIRPATTGEEQQPARSDLPEAES